MGPHSRGCVFFVFNLNLINRISGNRSAVSLLPASMPRQAPTGAGWPWAAWGEEGPPPGPLYRFSSTKSKIEVLNDSLARMQKATGRAPAFVRAGSVFNRPHRSLAPRSTLSRVSLSRPQKRSMSPRAPVVARAPSPDCQAQPRPAHWSQATAAQNDLAVPMLGCVRHSLATGS